MRVIAGTWRGLRLAPVPGTGTRPTADRVKEAIFSRLESRYALDGANVLDLYAGTGALGIEALSRGAATLVSVERNRRAAAVLAENIGLCGVRGQAEIRIGDVGRELAALARAGARFDGVLIDPPYESGLAAPSLASLGGSGMIVPGGWAIVETASSEELPQEVGVLQKVREDLYGDTKVLLYESRERGGAQRDDG